MKKTTACLLGAWVLGVALQSTACRSKACAPGQQIACACLGGEQGIQVCDQDGASFLQCDCHASATSTATVHATPRAQDANDGTDPRRPVLAPEDAGFVDLRGGWGWSDRCWINLKKGKLGWAKAECAMAMAMKPASPSPLASILYNLGLIEKAAGDVAAAKHYFARSLGLREHPEVRAALESLPGGGGSSPRSRTSFACGPTRCRSDQVCCPLAEERCVSAPSSCGDDSPEDSGEVADYAPFSRTTGGYRCNPKTHEPCAAGEKCRVGKVGHGPLTMTGECAR